MLIHKICNLCLIAGIVFISLRTVCYGEDLFLLYEQKGLPLTAKSYTKSSVNYKSVEAEADRLFYAGIEAREQSLKEAYLSKALVKYMLLLTINPQDIICNTQVGVIHDQLNHPKLAKDFFYQAINLDAKNPFANFYFGEFFYRKRCYIEALKHYRVAYKNGYQNFYEINLKLGQIYEKLGDIEKAKLCFNIARKQSSNPDNLDRKLKALDNVYYSKSDYK